WEAQQTDYPSVGPDRPEYEPRGCPRGAAFSWYTYSPTRVRYPYVRGVLLEMYRDARSRLGDPVDAWAAIVEGPAAARRQRAVRGGSWQGWPGPGDVGRGDRAHRGRARVHHQDVRTGPVGRFLPDPGHVDGVACGRRAFLQPDRRRDAVVLRLVRRPSGRVAA